MMCFDNEELYIIAAALEYAYEHCEEAKMHELADKFAEIYNKVDERLSAE